MAPLASATPRTFVAQALAAGGIRLAAQQARKKGPPRQSAGQSHSHASHGHLQAGTALPARGAWQPTGPDNMDVAVRYNASLQLPHAASFVPASAAAPRPPWPAARRWAASPARPRVCASAAACSARTLCSRLGEARGGCGPGSALSMSAPMCDLHISIHTLAACVNPRPCCRPARADRARARGEAGPRACPGRRRRETGRR